MLPPGRRPLSYTWQLSSFRGVQYTKCLMTSGAFYSQFKSKKELLSEVFARGCDALDQYFSQARKAGGLPGIAAAYLSPKHREDIAGGCAVTSLIGDLVRCDKDTKRKMTVYLTKIAHELSRLLPNAKRSEREKHGRSSPS
jgi:AcrR family transcriptional regulator